MKGEECVKNDKGFVYLTRPFDIIWMTEKKYNSIRKGIRFILFIVFFLTISWRVEKQQRQQRILVVYVFPNQDLYTEANLRFFLKYGMSTEEKYTYVFVVQEGQGIKKFSGGLPEIPKNARYVWHENRCWDIGTVGWLLFTSGEVDVKDFSYFIWLNPTVRGPFVGGLRDSRKWADDFISKLSSSVKLVGTIMSCSGIHDPTFGLRENPHLMGTVIVTDRVGLRILRDSGSLACVETYTQSIFTNELGASRAILSAGYNIASSLMRYRDVDWRDLKNWNCNRKRAPHVGNQHGGIVLDPLDAVFMKVKKNCRLWPSTQRALVYSEHIEGNISLQTNSISNDHFNRSQVQKIYDYFDMQYYREKNSKDLSTFGEKELWCHFLHHGFTEIRPFRLQTKTKSTEFGGSNGNSIDDIPTFISGQPAPVKKKEIIKC